jgi:hypothetical protein
MDFLALAYNLPIRPRNWHLKFCVVRIGIIMISLTLARVRAERIVSVDVTKCPPTYKLAA